MTASYYNNLGIGVIAIGAVLNQSKKLCLSKLFLIFPLLSHRELLQHLGRKTTTAKSVDKLIVEKLSFFSNFNRRFLESLALTVNSLQYLIDTGHVELSNGVVTLAKPYEYDAKMGSRAKKIFKAANNVSLILEDKAEKLYLNFRVEL